MLKLFPIATLLLALLDQATSAAYPPPGKCGGVCVNTHDPSIIRHQKSGKYFRFSTGGGIAVHSAPFLEGNWTYDGSVLKGPSKVALYNGKTDVWAPSVHLVGDTYYLYYSVVREHPFDGHNLAAIGVATSSTLEVGSWVDLGSTGISSHDGSPYNAIDPSLFEEDERLFLIFGSYEQGLYQASMKSPPTSIVSSAFTKLTTNPAHNIANEGSTMFKHGKYNYLFFSNGECCGYDKKKPAAGLEYKIKVCRSPAGKIDFRDANDEPCTQGKGTVVLESHDNVYGPGGQGVYDDKKEGIILYYHYVDTTISFEDGQKRFGWNKLDFSSGWPVVK